MKTIEPHAAGPTDSTDEGPAAPSREPRWLDEAEQQAWRSFLRMQAQLTARLGRELQADSELSLADYDVLVHLTDLDGGRLRILELARELDWEKSRMSHHLARMTKRGLIARQECPADGRGSFIVITEQGKAAIEAAALRHVAMVRRFVFDALSPEQVGALASASERILEQLDGPDRPDPCDG
jgi:DNA-binding MarR family transcriptional regulator